MGGSFDGGTGSKATGRAPEAKRYLSRALAAIRGACTGARRNEGRPNALRTARNARAEARRDGGRNAAARATLRASRAGAHPEAAKLRRSPLAARMLALALAAFAALALAACSQTDISPSTVQREALPESAVTETAYYEDQAGWISDPTALEEGMRHFFEETGVQPYLAILEDGSATSSQDISEKAGELYAQLFSDEGHFLFAICDDGEGRLFYGSHIGSDAEDVLDDEATTIFLEYLEQYNADESLSKEQLFSSTFASTADRIMQTAVPPFFDVLVYVGVIVIAAGVVLVVRRLGKGDPAPRKKAKKR